MDKKSARVLRVPTAGPLGGASSAGSAATVLEARGLTTNNGHLVQAGGSVNIQQYYNTYPEPKLNIASVLRLVNNLRRIHLDILSKATPGTGMWFFKTDEFILWFNLNGDLRILWGTGIPGAGKSVMASIVINELEARSAAAGGSVCVCYIYFRYSDGAVFTIRDILEILVKQTVERHYECASLAEEIYSRHLRENTQPTEAELLQLLRQFIETKPATFYVLDALDEALDKLQLELVKKLASLNVRLFITARPLKGVEDCVYGVRSIPIVAQAQDLELHINSGIERSSNLQTLLNKAGPSLREEIVTSIKQNCAGMFLHASLQLDSLYDCLRPGDVRRALKAFPSNIKDVYLQTWNRIVKRNPTHVALAKAVLFWVLNAARSMSLEELECAVATSPKTYKFEPDELVPGATLLSLCRGLVTYEEESRVVRLVHYTAKAALQELLHGSFPHLHSHLSMVCVTHLTECGFQNTPMRSKEEFTAALAADPLLAYASDAWPVHARESLEVEDSRRRIAHFVHKSKAFPAFINPKRPESFDILRPFHIIAIYDLPMNLITHGDLDDPNVATQIYHDPPLVLASWVGHRDIVKSLLARLETQVNFVDKDGWTALIFAARYGREDIVRLLLAHTEIQINLLQDRGWSALMLAATNGHKGIVECLLARSEIQINLVDNQGRSALVLAAENGQECTLKLLLAHPDIQIHLVENTGSLALMLAARNGHKGAVKVLLAHPGSQVNSVDHKGWSALMHAAYNGHVGAVVSLLLHPQVDVNLLNNEGWSALVLAAGDGHLGVVTSFPKRVRFRVNEVSVADDSSERSGVRATSRNGHKGVVDLLLARSDIQLNLADKDGCSALLKAAAGGREVVVKILLAQPEIEVNFLNDEGQSALMLAASKGHTGVVELLLARHKLQVNLAGNDGWSALMLATAYRHEGVVRLLLARPEIQVNLVSKKGWSALMAASRSGYEVVVKLLLARPEIQVNLVDEDGWSALMKAASKGHEGIVRALLSRRDIKVNTVSEQGWSALMDAAHRGNECVVTLLLAHPEILVNLVSRKGLSALMAAARSGHEGIVKLLLARPEIQVNLVAEDGWSALMKAASKGHEDTVRALLAHREIKVNLTEKDEWPSLMLAAHSGHKRVVALLLAHSEIQVNLVSKQGWSALMDAAHNGREGIVTLLLAHPEIQVNLVNNEGLPALTFATSNGHEGVVKLLLAQPGIQVNLVDDEGWSALMVAAYDGYESIVTLLLVRPEIQVNLVSNKGWSALMLAAGKGHKAIVHLLLDASNLDTTIKNVESGHTASLIALANGHLEIAQLLREFELHRAALLSIDSSVKDIADPGQPVLQELVHEEMGEGVSDQGANDKQTPDEPSGRSRGAKRSRDNEEDSLESSVDDVTAPPALKRHCGVEAAEGPLA